MTPHLGMRLEFIPKVKEIEELSEISIESSSSWLTRDIIEQSKLPQNVWKKFNDIEKLLNKVP